MLTSVQYVDEREVAKITGFSLSTLRNERCTRRLKIPHYKVGRSVRYKISDILDFMESHRIEPEATMQAISGDA